MRRLAELFKTMIQNPTRHPGMRVAVFSLLAFALLTFTTFAHAQTGMVTSDFEDGQLDGWVQSGSPATLQATTEIARSGTHSLKVAGRANSWDGASMNFLGVMHAGEAWEFSAWVRLTPGSAPAKVGLQMHDDKDSSGWGGYPMATYPDGIIVTDKAWVQVKGRYPNAGTLNPDGTVLSLSLNAPSGTDFYVDDFVAYKQEASGCYAAPDITGDSSTFETELNWAGRPWSNVVLTLTNADAHSGSQSMLQSARTQPWNTAGYLATGKMCNGGTYKISVWAKMAPGMPAADMNVQAKASKAGVADAYLTLSPTKTVDSTGWVQFTGTYDMRTDYDVLWIYLNPISDATSSFYVDDFTLTYIPAGQSVEQIPSIGEAYKSSFPVGAAVYGADVDIANLHSELLALHFTSVTPENDMKWASIEPAENTFDFAKADAIVAFAKSHNMAVRGHTLVWHQQTPDWVFKDANGVDMSTLPYSDANKALLVGRMKNHIQNLISHFGADVTSWDVVNEAFDESQPDGFRRSKWYTIYGGPGYIDDAFKFAKEAVDAAALGGKVKLYLNDYNTTVASKLGFITSYLTTATAAGVPIDGVGHQLHNKLDWPINDDPNSIKSVTDAVDAVAALGLDNQVTEMDLSIYRANAVGQTTYNSYADVVANLKNDLIIQGYRYRDYFSAFKTLAEAHKLSSVTLWGQADDHTWLTSSAKTDAPLPFDNNLHFKPAYTGIMDAQSLPNALPYSVSASTATLLNTAKEITMVASDANGDPLTYTVTAPAHGSLGTVTGNTVTYTPSTDYVGADSFTFSANDGKGDGNVATITIDVMAAPVAHDQSVTTDLNTAKAITIAADGHGTITYAVASQPAHGTLTGNVPNLTYKPATDYWGSDSFTFKANNGLDSNVATVSITVLPSTATAKDQSVTVDYSTPTRIKLTSTGNGTMTYSIVDFPAKGTLTPVAGDSSTWVFTATPASFTDPYMTKPPEEVDQTSFTFKVNNGHDSNVATVSITVKPAALKVAAAAGQSTSASVSAGQSAAFNLTVHGYQTYSAKNAPPVSFTCGGVPNYATCTVTPNIVTLDDNMTPVPFKVTISTSSSSGAAAGSTFTLGSGPRTPWLPACALAAFVLIFITMRRTKMQWRMVGASAALLFVMSFTGCGGNSTTNSTRSNMVATPPGTYTVTVTAIGTRTLSGVQQSDWKVIGDIPLTITVK